MEMCSIRDRKSKVHCADFACYSDDKLCFPKILAGNTLRSVVGAINAARGNNRPVVAMLGGHVIKCGLVPILIGLMRDDIITAVAMNGAAAIHDVEIALFGETSEYVDESLPAGKWGMWKELNILNSLDGNKGIGEQYSDIAIYGDYARYSILATAWNMEIPVTVHISIGCDITHYHPNFDAAVLGSCAGRDLMAFKKIIAEAIAGGVVLNFGSAVMMPEIFIKSVNAAIGNGVIVENFTACNFDMIDHYRPKMNLVDRVNLIGGRGYSLIGHHEIMIPLLAHAILGNMAL